MKKYINQEDVKSDTRLSNSTLGNLSLLYKDILQEIFAYLNPTERLLLSNVNFFLNHFIKKINQELKKYSYDTKYAFQPLGYRAIENNQQLEFYFPRKIDSIHFAKAYFQCLQPNMTFFHQANHDIIIKETDGLTGKEWVLTIPVELFKNCIYRWNFSEIMSFLKEKYPSEAYFKFGNALALHTLTLPDLIQNEISKLTICLVYRNFSHVAVAEQLLVKYLDAKNVTVSYRENYGYTLELNLYDNKHFLYHSESQKFEPEKLAKFKHIFDLLLVDNRNKDLFDELFLQIEKQNSLCANTCKP
jgi:hypothetical protein